MELFHENNDDNEQVINFGLRKEPDISSEKSAVRYAQRIDPQIDLLTHRDWSIRTAAHLIPESLSNLHALDIGCGEGRWSRFMATRGATVQGLDIFPAVLDIARQRSTDQSITYVTGSIETFPVFDKSFDFGMASYVFHNTTNIEKALQSCRMLMSEKGTLVIITRTFDFSETHVGTLKGYFLPVLFDKKYSVSIPALSSEDFEKAACSAHFEVLHTQQQVSDDCFGVESLTQSGIGIKDTVFQLRAKKI